MSEWIVYKKGGQSELCRIKSLQYDGSWMGECSITATIKSATPLSFSIGDYLEYRGERFEINYDPTVIKSATSGTYGEGFVYDNVKFNSLSDELTRCDFLDYVPDDNLIHYSSLPTFSFFADNISKLAERIQVNLDRVYTGEKKWTVEVHPEYVDKENVNISVSNQTCWDALALVKSEFDANFIIKNRTIIIGTEGIAVGKVFSYGKGNGLVTIERNAETDQKIVTRLRAYGSTKNLPFRYYARIGEGVIPNNMAIQNLMLPGFPDATTDPYIDSPNIDELGVREGTVFFDGSNGLPEIFPSMENMTAEELKGAGVNVNATGRLDEVLDAEQITDNGIFEPSEGETEVTIPTFTVTLKDIGFNINDYLSSAGTATISMKDGMCGGRDFEIVGCEKTDEGYVLTCNRSEDTSLGLFFPYNIYNIQSGDKFVLLNIEMPDVYIQTASQRLYDAARDWLYKNDYVRYSYTPKVDNVFMARQHDASLTNNDASIHDTIKEGDLMLFEDTDLNIEGSVIIDTLSIKEGESAIPQYEITLRNDKTVGTIQKIQNQIDSIVSGKTGVNAEGGYNASQIKSLIKAFGSTFFLRKDQDDRSKGKIASDVGFEVGTFVSGASGAIIQVDKTTGQTVAELDKLYVRMKAYFETLEIINVNSVGGRMILSPAGSVTCLGVEETDDAYRCYFLGEQDGEVIENRFESGDQAYSEMFNAKDGVTNKVSNHYYWRLVTGVSEDVVDYNNQKCHYIELSKTDCDADSDVPKAGDVICHRGSRTETDRMNFIEFSSVGVNAPYITLFQGVGGTAPYYSLTDKEYVSYGYDQSTGRAYMNVYGDMYVGDRNQTSYIRYTPENGLEIKGKLSVGTTLGGKDLQEMINAASPEGYQEFVDKVTQDIEGLQNQIDGTIDSYFFQYNPSLTNYPASEWDTENEKIAHLNDTFTNIASDSGRSWRWVKDPNTGVYSWTEITDTATTQALALAGQAQDTADGKRRVFVDTPTPPYDKGDLWSRGSDYPLMICVTSKSSGSYAEADWDYADNNVKLKEEMQSLVETTKGDLNNAIGQANEAIGKLDESLTQAKTDLQGALNELNDAKGDIESIYDWAAKDGEFTDIEKVALDAAVAQSNAAVEYYDTLVKAYADGTISEEEKEKIQGAKASLDAAKKYADETAEAVFAEEINKHYLTQALTQSPDTSILNGLILSSLIQLRDSDSNVMSGINGLIDEAKGDKSIANWWGGIMGDMTDYYTWNGREWVAKSGVTIPSNLPSGLIRMDGTGYLAKGKFWWDEDGRIYADPTALFLSFNVDDPAVSFSATILDIKDKQAEFSDMWEVKTDASGTEYLFAKRNIVTQGGVTAYADTTGLDIEGIYDDLPIDGTTIYWDGDVLKAKVAEGGITSITKDMVIDALGFTPYDASNPNGYITSSALSAYLTKTSASSTYQPKITSSNMLAYSLISGTPDLSVYALKSSLHAVATSGSYNDLTNKPTIPASLKNPYALSWSGYSSGSYDGSSAKSITIPSNTNQLTNGAGFITSSVSGSISLNGDWENDFGINFNEGGGATYGFSLLYGAGDLFKLVTRANSTTNTTIFSVTRGSSVLNFANTPTVNGSSVWHAGNDGSGSGLDADTLDGIDSSSFARNQVINNFIYSGNEFNFVPSAYSGIVWFNYQTQGGKNGNITTYHFANGSGSTNVTLNATSFTGNAASATKLQTKRALWGNDFDGTGSINGSLYLANHGIHLAVTSALGWNQTYILSTGWTQEVGDFTDIHVPSSSANDARLRLLKNGNVGIGTTNPVQKLHVNGNIHIESGYSVLGGSAAIIASLNGSVELKCDNINTNAITFTTAKEFRPFSESADAINLGNSSYRWKNIYGNNIDLKSSLANIITIRRAATGSGAFIDYYYNNLSDSQWRVGGGGDGIFTFNKFNGTSESQGLMTISASGNVGIGTTSPAHALDVNGNIGCGHIYHSDGVTYLVMGALNNVRYVNVGQYNNPTYSTYLNLNASLATRWISAAGSEIVRIDHSNGYVGIGTTSPSKLLHVYGATNQPILVQSSTAAEASINYTNVSGHTWVAGVGPSIGGNTFGIWSATYGLTMHIDASANMLVRGGITSYSDIRKKEKLQDVQLTLKQIADAPLIEHYYKHDDKKTTHVGSIAQYWAGMNDWFCKLDSEGYYTMEIQNAALASAISIARELVKYESKTDRTIRLLKKRINQLEDEIEILKKGA